MKVLTKRDEKVIRALAQSFLTPGGGIREDAVDAHVVEFIDDWMSRLARAEQLKIRALFHMFEYWFAVHAMSPFARFTAATDDQRAQYLSAWEHSGVYARRLAFQGIRQIISIAYFEHGGVREQVGLAAPGTTEVTDHLQRLAEAADLLTAKRPAAMKKVG
jgi:hypothetical protein